MKRKNKKNIKDDELYKEIGRKTRLLSDELLDVIKDFLNKEENSLIDAELAIFFSTRNVAAIGFTMLFKKLISNNIIDKKEIDKHLNEYFEEIKEKVYKTLP